MPVLGIIPARYASSRFPGKPLVEILGQSMLSRVYEQARKARALDEIIIATDDQRIYDHAKTFGAKVVMTKTTHVSGTDRCWEAYQNFGKQFTHVLNIQGDEPFLAPEQIDSIAGECDDKMEIGTQMTLCTDHEVLFDTGEVKIVLNEHGEAIYFSRSVIPYLKNHPQREWPHHFNYYRHVGMYAYRVDVLEKICALAPTSLEKAESLEQLRWLEHGFKIKCIETNFDSHCIDSPDDIEKVLRLMDVRNSRSKNPEA
jgi:3-deoxy-manno-octulosonate cytidylyltransferase (CMP-KDO synthetase)